MENRKQKTKSNVAINKRLKNYSIDKLKEVVNSALKGNGNISEYERCTAFNLLSNLLMTESEWIKHFKKNGFSLFKTNPTNKKLRTLFKIQKLTSEKSIG